jgi:serine protease Do
MQRLRTGKGLAGLVALGVLAAVLVMTVAEDDARAQSRSRSGYLGVSLQDMNNELRESYGYNGAGGVLVSDLDDGGPASEAGIRQGDILLRFKGRSIESVDDLAARVRNSEPGEAASITAWRGGRERSFKVEIGSRGREGRRIIIDDDDHHVEIDPEDFKHFEGMKDFVWVQPHMEHWEDIADDIRVHLSRRARLGVRTQDLSEQLGEYFGARDGNGVLVIEVIEDTPAEEAGLRAGDVIVEIDGKAIEDSEELREELSEKGAEEVAITILRKGSRYGLTAELEEPRKPRVYSFKGWPRGHGYHYKWHDDKGHHSWKWDEDDMDDLREELRELERELSKLRRELRDMDTGRK